MAERYNDSPTRASLHAFWTKNVQDRKHINKQQTNKDDDVIADESDLEDEEVKRNVWSDVDDELYIANVIKERTNERFKRDLDFSVNSEVVSSVKLDYEMWEIEPTDLTECDCLGPPPEFLLPPPPRPPFLQSEYYCADDPIPDLETCDTEPVSTYLATCFFINF